MTERGEEAAAAASEHALYQANEVRKRDNMAYAILFEKWCKEHAIDISHKKNRATAFSVWRLMVEMVEKTKTASNDLQVKFEMCEMGYNKKCDELKILQIELEKLKKAL